MKASIGFLAAFVVSFAAYQSDGGQLIENGDFDRPFTEGWTLSVPATATYICQSADLHPDPDMELSLLQCFPYQYTPLFTLSQTVSLKDADLRKYAFSIDLMFSKQNGDDYAAAGLTLRLLDERDGVLRANIIFTLSDTLNYSVTKKASFYDSVHGLWHDPQYATYQEIRDTATWHTYSFPLDQAFAGAAAGGGKASKVECILWAAAGGHYG